MHLAGLNRPNRAQTVDSRSAHGSSANASTRNSNVVSRILVTFPTRTGQARSALGQGLAIYGVGPSDQRFSTHFHPAPVPDAAARLAFVRRRSRLLIATGWNLRAHSCTRKRVRGNRKICCALRIAQKPDNPSMNNFGGLHTTRIAASRFGLIGAVVARCAWPASAWSVRLTAPIRRLFLRVASGARRCCRRPLATSRPTRHGVDPIVLPCAVT
jgi:hypothetical protein